MRRRWGSRLGAHRDEAFAQAALALVAVSTELVLVATRERVQVACQTSDEEMLLFEWLNAVAYQMATRKLIFGASMVLLANAFVQLEVGYHGDAHSVDRHTLLSGILLRLALLVLYCGLLDKDSCGRTDKRRSCGSREDCLQALQAEVDGQ